MKHEMTDEFLDEVMRKVQSVEYHYYEVQEAAYTHEEVIYKLKPSIDYLLDNGYITSRPVGSQKYLDISPKGIRLQQEGGFVQINKEKNDLMSYSKGSFEYAKKAYYAAIVAIVIAIIIAILTMV